MRPDPRETMQLEKLRLSASALDRELTLFWLKALFFGGFVALALLGYALAALSGVVLAQIFSAAAGAFVTVCWIGVCSASRYDQSVWQGRVDLLEDYTIGELSGVDEGPGRQHPLKTGLNLSIPVIMMMFCGVLFAVFATLIVYTLIAYGMPGVWRSPTVKAVVSLIILLCFVLAAYLTLRLSRDAIHERPQGLIDPYRYL